MPIQQRAELDDHAICGFGVAVHQLSDGIQRVEQEVRTQLRLQRERYQAEQTATQRAKKVLKTNRESNAGYSNQAASDRTLKIKGRG